MSLQQALAARSPHCELCTSTEDLDAFAVAPKADDHSDNCAYLCATCRTQISTGELNADHWRCLNDSMWSPTPAVQVLAARLLNTLSQTESWADNLKEMLYLDEELQTWVDAATADNSGVVHKDSNGAVLTAGDNVTLIKDLDVKGANFTAKRGTAVRGISLVADNAEHIEGRVNGQRIVILTQFVKKS